MEHWFQDGLKISLDYHLGDSVRNGRGYLTISFPVRPLSVCQLDEPVAACSFPTTFDSRNDPNSLKGNIIPRFALICTSQFDDARQRDQLLPVIKAHLERCMKEESGRPLEYRLFVPHGDETKLVGFGVYESEDSWATHHDGPSVQRYRKEAAALGWNTLRCTFIKVTLVD
ncbi:putative quinol monooxygenase [Bradyrhizobium hipponense]|uniref:putative quinol monooxygenase n=1 Tax=Bradyrhizobium hipponense TaxID=2605638 RepID=UPI003D316D70